MGGKNILFFSDDVKYRIQGKKLLYTWIESTVRAEKKESEEINIILCSDRKILKINREFLAHDYYTDVISFNYNEGDAITGDIFISIDRVKDNSLKYKVPVANELARVIIHGILHLCGYRDSKESLRKHMKEKEDFYLSLLK
jgi:probable rRNA maturation factor